MLRTHYSEYVGKPTSNVACLEWDARLFEIITKASGCEDKLSTTLYTLLLSMLFSPTNVKLSLAPHVHARPAILATRILRYLHAV
jgi:hypothetical protein